MISKEQVLIEIKGSGLIYMGLYDLISKERTITPKRISEAIYAPLSFVLEYEYIWSIYIS